MGMRKYQSVEKTEVVEPKVVEPSKVASTSPKLTEIERTQPLDK